MTVRSPARLLRADRPGSPLRGAAFGLAATLAALLAVAGPAALAQGLLPPGEVARGPAKPKSDAKPDAKSDAKPATKPQAFKPAPPALAQTNPKGMPIGPAAPAVDGRAARSTVDRLTAYYNSVQALTGTFTQIDPDGTRRTGDIYMQKPGRVRFEYDPPSPVELISNGQSVAVRDRKLNTQDITPLSQTPLRFLLAERVDLASDPHVSGIYQDARFLSVVMQEKVPMMGTYRLLVLFDAKDYSLKQWIVTDPQGYDTQVTLNKVQVNKKPDPRLFVINFERILQ